MKALASKDIETNARYQLQNAYLAIRDCFDGIVELVTNVDDRYEVLKTEGGCPAGC